MKTPNKGICSQARHESKPNVQQQSSGSEKLRAAQYSGKYVTGCTFAVAVGDVTSRKVSSQKREKNTYMRKSRKTNKTILFCKAAIETQTRENIRTSGAGQRGVL